MGIESQVVENRNAMAEWRANQARYSRRYEQKPGFDTTPKIHERESPIPKVSTDKGEAYERSE